MLDDIAALNKHFKLDNSRKLVEFHPTLLKLMNLRKWDRVFPDNIPNYSRLTQYYKDIGYAWCGVADGKPVCAFGVIPLWRGVGDVWMLTDAELPSYGRTFHRVAKGMFDIYIDELNIIRLQCTVHAANFQAIKWIKAMYFKQEGLLEKYGPDGCDFYMFARLKNERDFRRREISSSPPRT
jgi:hypothetical protein